MGCAPSKAKPTFKNSHPAEYGQDSDRQLSQGAGCFGRFTRAEKVENCLCNCLLPHFGQLLFVLLSRFSRSSTTWPHCAHLYSKIGISNLFLKKSSPEKVRNKPLSFRQSTCLYLFAIAYAIAGPVATAFWGVCKKQPGEVFTRHYGSRCRCPALSQGVLGL